MCDHPERRAEPVEEVRHAEAYDLGAAAPTLAGDAVMCAGGMTLDALVAKHATFVRLSLARLGVPAKDLPDVEQEVFRGVARGLPAFDPALASKREGAVKGWIYGICERQAASYRRAQNKRSEVLFATEDMDATSDGDRTVEDELVSRERAALLGKLLATLEPLRRAVVVAYELEGVPMVDVAAALSIPVNTAWNRLRLARADLREAAKRHLRTVAPPRGRCPLRGHSR